MDHGYYTDRISAYFDGQLTPDERAAISRHLADCDECRQQLKRLEQFNRLAQENSLFSDDDYWERSARRIESRLDEAPAHVRAPSISWWRTGLAWKVTAAAASIALISIVALHEDEIQRQVISESPPPENRISRFSPTPPDTSTRSLTAEDAESYNLKDANPDVVVPSLKQKPLTSKLQVLGEAEREAKPATGQSTLEHDRSRLSVGKVQVEQSDASQQMALPAARKKVERKPSTKESLGVTSSTKEHFESPAGSLRVAFDGIAVSQKTDLMPEFADEDRSLSNLSETLDLKSLRNLRDSLGRAVSQSESTLLKAKLASPAAPDSTISRQLVDIHFQITRLSPDSAEVSRSIEYLESVARRARDGAGKLARDYLSKLKGKDKE
ncbi:MAG: anti-sigma factor family protein [Candidatus Zixiibacteriota bacterium]